MIPRTEHQKNFMFQIVGFERGVFLLWSPQIFLIPVAANLQRGHGGGGEMRLHGARLPEGAVVGVLDERLPGGELGQAGFLGGSSERAGLQEKIVSVLF